MSVLHSQNSIIELTHEWWLDCPLDMDAGPANQAAESLEPEQLQWIEPFELPWDTETVCSTPAVLLPVKTQPPCLDKFKQELEDLSMRLDLAEEVKKRASFYLPHLRGRMGDRRTTCAALVFMASLKAGAPRCLREVAAASGAKPAQLRRRVRLIQRHMDESKWIMEPEHLLPRYCAMLRLPFATEKKARHLLRNRPTSKKDPSVLAAASLLAVHPTLSPSVIHRFTGVSRTSLYSGVAFLNF